MKNFRHSIITLMITFTGLLLSTGVLAKGAELKFDSTVVATTTAGVDTGTVTVEFNDFEVPLNVNGDTEIREGSIEITLAEVQVGDAVHVEAFFSDEGVTAEEILIMTSSGEQFRLRGRISDVIPDVASPEGTGELVTQIALLGVDVYANADTLITDRATGGGNTVLVTDLQSGDLIDVYGTYTNALVADRIHVGTRQLGQFEFEGTINATDGDMLELRLRDGGVLTLLITDESMISGEVEEGVFVEVEGMLNADLMIEIYELVVDDDNDGDADDDHKRGHRHGHGPDVSGNPNSATVSANLTAVGGDSSASGNIRVSIAPNGQEVRVKVEGAAPNTMHTVHVLVGGVPIELGSVESDDEGEVEIELKSTGNSPASLLLPAGTTTADLTDVEVSVAGTVVLSGLF